jgi:hypothetical protein
MAYSPFGGALPHPILVEPRAQSEGQQPRDGDRGLANREREVKCFAVFCKRASTRASDEPG